MRRIQDDQRHHVSMSMTRWTLRVFAVATTVKSLFLGSVPDPWDESLVVRPPAPPEVVPLCPQRIFTRL